MFLIWTTYGTLNFHDTRSTGNSSRACSGRHGWPRRDRLSAAARRTAIWPAAVVRGVRQERQFPLHVWLPDAMEGPTPVSALIHAATMVTAGVYLVARCTPLVCRFARRPGRRGRDRRLHGPAGRLIALTQTDLKRILAYSTISQLGYMFLALGTGTLLGVTAGMFHLLTHAFFKALLFLGAGSVMHAMGGVIDIRRFGGLRRRMPITHWTFLFGCLAIAGMFPFAGFWSKDAILAGRPAPRGPGQFRANLRNPVRHCHAGHPADRLLHVPAVFPHVLWAGTDSVRGRRPRPRVARGNDGSALGAGLRGHGRGRYFEAVHGFAPFLAATPSLAYLPPQAPAAAEAAGHVRMGVTSTIITAVGIAAAAAIYLGTTNGAARLARLMNVFGLYTLSYAKFFFDPLYTLLVVRPLLGLARLAALFDQYVIDGLIDLCGKLPRLVGEALRPTQNGLLQFYAMMMMIGLFVLLGALLM